MLGTPLHTDQGQTLVAFVPPGMAELTPKQDTSQVYVLAVFGAASPGTAGRSDAVVTVDASSHTAGVRGVDVGASAGRSELLEPLGDSPTLLGFQFFYGSQDSMAQMQFGDVKASTHGIVHMSRHAPGEL